MARPEPADGWAGAGRLVPQKPNSGHTDTISITFRVPRVSWNAMKPRTRCAPTRGVWLLRSGQAGETSCATDVTCGSGVSCLPGWRHPGNRNDATSWRSGPQRCHIVAVGGASPAPPDRGGRGRRGLRGREGCAEPPAGNSLLRSHTHAASTPHRRRRGGEPHGTADPLLPIGLIRNFRDAKHPRTESGDVI